MIEKSKEPSDNQLAAVKFQLISKRPGEIRIALKQIQKWLTDDPENSKIFQMLLGVTKEQPESIELVKEVNELLEGISQKGSTLATETIELLPVTTKDLLNRAEEAYYVADFEKASRICHKILEKEASNQQAKDLLTKVELAKTPAKPAKNLPREAVRWYRQARSYLAAKDYQTAVTFLKAAIDSAKAGDSDFEEARELLKEVEHLLSTPKSRPKVFVSYSHKDETFKNDLVSMLTPLQNQGILEIWQDRYIEEGDEWYQAIKNAINTCDLALLLISREFLASRFIQNDELPSLLQRRKEEGLRIIPIILRPCLWQDIPILKDILALPTDGKPMVSFDEQNGEREKTWANIAKIIGERAKQIASGP